MEGTHLTSKKDEPSCKDTNSSRSIHKTLAFSHETNSPSSSLLSAAVFGPGEENFEHDQDQVVRERLKKHREEIAGRIVIPETWGHEDLLKEWMDCSAFDELLAPDGIASARAALVAEGRRAPPPQTAPVLRI